MLLSLSIFIPMAGAVAVLLCPKDAKGLIRTLALATSIATFVPIAMVALDYSKNVGEAAPVALQRLSDTKVASIADSGLRAEVETLLKDPQGNAPGKLTPVKKAELRSKGVYDAWHEAWELKVAATGAMTKEIRYVEYGNWIKAFNINYFLGVDGLSLVMLLLNAALSILCIYYSFQIEKGVKAYMALFLLLVGGVNGGWKLIT